MIKQIENLQAQLLLEKHAIDFKPNQVALDLFKKMRGEDGSKPTLFDGIHIVEGDPGIGKSATARWLANSLRGVFDENRIISFYFCKNDAILGNRDSFYELATAKINDLLAVYNEDTTPNTPAPLIPDFRYFKRQLFALSEKIEKDVDRNILIIIDGVEEVLDSDGFLRDLPPARGIGYLIFTQPGVCETLPINLKDKGETTLAVMSQTDAEDFFWDAYGKEEDEAYAGQVKRALDKIISDPQNRTGLLLKCLAEDFKDRININVGEISGLKSYFKERMADYNEAETGVLSLLAISGDALMSEDICQIAGVAPAECDRIITRCLKFVKKGPNGLLIRQNAWRQMLRTDYVCETNWEKIMEWCRKWGLAPSESSAHRYAALNYVTHLCEGVERYKAEEAYAELRKIYSTGEFITAQANILRQTKRSLSLTIKDINAVFKMAIVRNDMAFCLILGDYREVVVQEMGFDSDTEMKLNVSNKKEIKNLFQTKDLNKLIEMAKRYAGDNESVEWNILQSILISRIPGDCLRTKGQLASFLDILRTLKNGKVSFGSLLAEMSRGRPRKDWHAVMACLRRIYGTPEIDGYVLQNLSEDAGTGDMFGYSMTSPKTILGFYGCAVPFTSAKYLNNIIRNIGFIRILESSYLHILFLRKKDFDRATLAHFVSNSIRSHINALPALIKRTYILKEIAEDVEVLETLREEARGGAIRLGREVVNAAENNWQKLTLREKGMVIAVTHSLVDPSALERLPGSGPIAVDPQHLNNRSYACLSQQERRASGRMITADEKVNLDPYSYIASGAFPEFQEDMADLLYNDGDKIRLLPLKEPQDTKPVSIIPEYLVVRNRKVKYISAEELVSYDKNREEIYLFCYQDAIKSNDIPSACGFAVMGKTESKRFPELVAMLSKMVVSKNGDRYVLRVGHHKPISLDKSRVELLCRHAIKYAQKLPKTAKCSIFRRIAAFPAEIVHGANYYGLLTKELSKDKEYNEFISQGTPLQIASRLIAAGDITAAISHIRTKNVALPFDFYLANNKVLFPIVPMPESITLDLIPFSRFLDFLKDPNWGLIKELISRQNKYSLNKLSFLDFDGEVLKIDDEALDRSLKGATELPFSNLVGALILCYGSTTQANLNRIFISLGNEDASNIARIAGSFGICAKIAPAVLYKMLNLSGHWYYVFRKYAILYAGKYPEEYDEFCEKVDLVNLSCSIAKNKGIIYARHYDYQGQSVLAKKTCEEYLSYHPDDCQALWLLTELYLEEGRLAKAKEIAVRLEKAAILMSPWFRAHSMATLAKIAFRMGSYDQAINYTTNSIRILKEPGTVALRIKGASLMEKGEYELAYKDFISYSEIVDTQPYSMSECESLGMIIKDIVNVSEKLKKRRSRKQNKSNKPLIKDLSEDSGAAIRRLFLHMIGSFKSSLSDFIPPDESRKAERSIHRMSLVFADKYDLESAKQQAGFLNDAYNLLKKHKRIDAKMEDEYNYISETYKKITDCMTHKAKIGLNRQIQ